MIIHIMMIKGNMRTTDHTARSLEPISQDALIFVYDRYLSYPYSDTCENRGFYIDCCGSYIAYPRGTQLVRERDQVYRPNHGLAHTVRVTFKVRDVVALYADPACNTNKKSQACFARLNNPEDISKLEIAAAFYVACRESEAEFNDTPHSAYKRYRKNSSNAFFVYAKTLKKSDGGALFAKEELSLYCSVVLDPYFQDESDGAALNGKDEHAAKKAAAKAILSSCHALDLARCFRVDAMNGKILAVLSPFGKKPTLAAKDRVAHCFLQSEIQHILTGNSCNCSFNAAAHTFTDQLILEKNALFLIAGTKPPIAIRLLLLSQCILSTDQAEKLALALDKSIKKNFTAFEELLNHIEQLTISEDFTAILDQFLSTRFPEIKKHEGYIFKTIRADEFDFWDKFATELLDPETSENRFEKRIHGPRLPFTIRLNPTTQQYEIIETAHQYNEHGEKIRQSPSLYSRMAKMSVTKHQSVSYANPNNNFKPPFFGHSRAHQQELLVGVAFSLKDCLFWKMMLYDGGTVDRPDDFLTREEAENYLQAKLQNGFYQTTLSGIEHAGKSHPAHYNEILAGLQWNLDGSSKIVIFTDNLESRLFAQLRALDLQNRLEEKYPDKAPIVVPIVFYPDFNPYTAENQRNDLSRRLNVACRIVIKFLKCIKQPETAYIDRHDFITMLMYSAPIARMLTVLNAKSYHAFLTYLINTLINTNLFPTLSDQIQEDPLRLLGPIVALALHTLTPIDIFKKIVGIVSDTKILTAFLNNIFYFSPVDKFNLTVIDLNNFFTLAKHQNAATFRLALFDAVFDMKDKAGEIIYHIGMSSTHVVTAGAIKELLGNIFELAANPPSLTSQSKVISSRASVLNALSSIAETNAFVRETGIDILLEALHAPEALSHLIFVASKDMENKKWVANTLRWCNYRIKNVLIRDVLMTMLIKRYVTSDAFIGFFKMMQESTMLLPNSDFVTKAQYWILRVASSILVVNNIETLKITLISTLMQYLLSKNEDNIETNATSFFQPKPSIKDARLLIQGIHHACGIVVIEAFIQSGKCVADETKDIDYQACLSNCAEKIALFSNAALSSSLILKS